MTTKRNPPIRCTPCKVRYQGEIYRIDANGQVTRLEPVNREMRCEVCYLRESAHDGRENHRYVASQMPVTVLLTDQFKDAETVSYDLARTIRQHASRLRRNRNARERAQARRDLGMKQTPYGWE